MDFINRSVGTPLETEYDLLVNLFLIKKRGRKVCLVESCGLSLKNSNLTYKKYYELINSIYPEFVYKINDYGETNNNVKNIQKANSDLYYATFFVSLSKIEEYDSQIETYDSYLGRILGFDEHGIPNAEQIRYTLRYSVVIQEQSKYNFYCEIVSDKSKINSKREKFNTILKELDWRVEEDIEEILPLKVWIESVINKGRYDGDKLWLHKRQRDFLEELAGYGWTLFDNYKLEELIFKHYSWLLFVVLACENDPFELLYPIHRNESDFILNYQCEIFKNESDKPPIILIDKMAEIDFIKLRFDSDPKFKDYYNRKRTDLINKFNDNII
tara:strand:+ start:286 stop:1269 length:984 start_codon:yes stop_codon:yes gene_type:complete